VELFLDRTPPLVEALEAALRSAKLRDVSTMAHKLKGSCLAVGAERLAAIAEHLQHAGREDDLAAAERALPLLLEQWSNVRRLLLETQRTAVQAPAPPV
jgi:hypothetical protein